MQVRLFGGYCDSMVDSATVQWIIHLYIFQIANIHFFASLCVLQTYIATFELI
jgi:hypothetical protein